VEKIGVIVPTEIYCGTIVKTFCDRLTAAPPLQVAYVLELNGEQLAAFEKPFSPSQQPKLFHPIRPRQTALPRLASIAVSIGHMALAHATL
jgi:hypothetical protein